MGSMTPHREADPTQEVRRKADGHPIEAAGEVQREAIRELGRIRISPFQEEGIAVMRGREAGLPVMNEVRELATVALELDRGPQAVAQGARRERAVLLRRHRLARR
eukprot:10284579-Alexandrium_andersonii.AAC.1